jgi:hypothetical protein
MTNAYLEIQVCDVFWILKRAFTDLRIQKYVFQFFQVSINPDKAKENKTTGGKNG